MLSYLWYILHDILVFGAQIVIRNNLFQREHKHYYIDYY